MITASTRKGTCIKRQKRTTHKGSSIRKGTCIKRQKRTTDKGCACFIFFIRRCLEVKARNCRGKDSACPFSVSAPPCGAFSNAPTSGFQANGLIYCPLFRAFAKHSYAPAATVRRADAMTARICEARNHVGEIESERAACCRTRKYCRG